MPHPFLFHVLWLFILGSCVLAWEAGDNEIFDLVGALEASEGKGVTFYKFLNVSKSATVAEINKASKLLSLKFHPDKNPNDKTMPARFARLGLITAILRDEEKRKRYNFFHDNGVPRWKGTGYMYSRWQPGLGFAISFVLGVATLMQYTAQHVTYRSEIARIIKFQAAAKQAAYGPKKLVLPGDVKTLDNETPSAKPLERKKVKVCVAKSLVGDGNEPESDVPVPKSRQERRRMKQLGVSSTSAGANPKWLDMIVEGNQVWIISEDGSELPLNEQVAEKPSLLRTFVPSTVMRLIGRQGLSGPTNAPTGATDSYEPGDLGTQQGDAKLATALVDGTSGSTDARAKKRKGGKSKN